MVRCLLSKCLKPKCMSTTAKKRVETFSKNLGMLWWQECGELVRIKGIVTEEYYGFLKDVVSVLG